MSKSQERVFQDDIISQMVAHGWQLGTPAGYIDVRNWRPDPLSTYKETS